MPHPTNQTRTHLLPIEDSTIRRRQKRSNLLPITLHRHNKNPLTTTTHVVNPTDPTTIPSSFPSHQIPPPPLKPPPPKPPPPKPPSRRNLVSFLVRSAQRFTHTDSEPPSSDSETDINGPTYPTSKLQTFVQNMFETNLLQQATNLNASNEIEKILTMTLTRLQKTTMQKNDHSIAGALHNLGCFYAGQTKDKDALSKGMALCTRALTMRRTLFHDRERTSRTGTPRNPERDELALAESLNDQGVLLLCLQNNDNDNVDATQKSKEMIENRARVALRAERLICEAKTMIEKIHSFLHPLVIQMLRNVAFAKSYNGNRVKALVLLRDALMRSKITKDPELIINVSLDLADICFRFHHLTKETHEVLSDAFALVTSNTLSTEYPFDPVTIGDIGKRLSMLSFSRRDYVSARRWSCEALNVVSHAAKGSMSLRLLRNDLYRLREHSEKRIERNRLYIIKKLAEEELERERLLILEKIQLGILNPDGSDPIEIEKQRQLRILEKKRIKQEKKEEKKRIKQYREEQEIIALNKQHLMNRPKSAYAGRRRNKNRNNQQKMLDQTSITSSVALEGERPRPVPNPFSSLAKRPKTAGGSGGGNGSPLSHSSWFQKRETKTKIWDRRVERKERRGERLSNKGRRKFDGKEVRKVSDSSHRVFTSPRVNPIPILSPIARVRDSLYITQRSRSASPKRFKGRKRGGNGKKKGKKRPKTALNQRNGMVVSGSGGVVDENILFSRARRAKSATGRSRRKRNLMFVPVPSNADNDGGEIGEGMLNGGSVYNEDSVTSIYSEGPITLDILGYA